MGLKDLVKNTINSACRAGEVNGYQFPFGTFVNFGTDNGEKYMTFTYPDKSEEKITHDMIKCATILAMGVINIKDAQQTKGLMAQNKTGVIQGNVAIEYGTKYLLVLKDGRQAVLSVGVGQDAYKAECVLF